MISYENSIGKPLADYNWLEIHHFAKIEERTFFAKKLANLNPKSIVDLGCASGLWLELLNQYVSDECEFIGIDSDQVSLNIAINKSHGWKRKSTFLKMDIEKDAKIIPPSDITLAFNIFPYIQNLDAFIHNLSLRNPCGTLAIRQYDGASIRFGPMPTFQRQKIESDLRIATETSKSFRHYDLDRTFNSIYKSNYSSYKVYFELFERKGPFNDNFIPYYNRTLEWTRELVSDVAKIYIDNFINLSRDNQYFYEVDLVALLS